MASNVSLGVQIPPEFDISKYADCETFSLVDWAQCIAARTAIGRIRDNLLRTAERNGDTAEGIERWKSRFLNEARALLADPLAFREFELDNLDAKTSLTGETRELVRHMNLTGYMQIRHEKERRATQGDNDPMCAYDDIYERSYYFDCTDEEEAALLTPYWQIEGRGYDGSSLIPHHGEIHATIDLHASEERLVESFIKWVRETKQDLGMPAQKKTFTLADQRQWVRNRVLAYFDLTHWCSLTDSKLSDNRIGLALFPDDLESANPADKVRKNVRPLAKAVFSQTIANALIDQARSLEQEG